MVQPENRIKRFYDGDVINDVHDLREAFPGIPVYDGTQPEDMERLASDLINLRKTSSTYVSPENVAAVMELLEFELTSDMNLDILLYEREVEVFIDGKSAIRLNVDEDRMKMIWALLG
jgi:hypothetical protein